MTSHSPARVRSFTALSCAAALLTSVTLTFPAAASESFPAHLAEKVGMPCVPACTLCHFTNLGGSDMLRPGFVVSLLETANTIGYPVEQGVPESMDPALAAMETMPKDYDMDMVPDLDELVAGSDPGGGNPICDVPKYGCGASVADTPPTRFGALALAASVMLALGLRRRR